MISLIDSGIDFEERINKIALNDPFACRIISLYNSYNPSLVFVDYWLALDEGGEPNGAIARNGSNFILLLTDRSDLGEISSFMRVAGASAVICNGAYALDLPCRKSVSGVILKRDLPFDDLDGTLKISVPDIKEAYELIKKCEDEGFTPPDFDDFYVDVNHKLRHGSMSLCAVTENGSAVALAMTVAESGTGAVLGAVSCDPEYRGKGYGSAVVKYLTDKMTRQKRTVFLHRARNANAAFYSGLGFAEAGVWREYYI